MVVNMRTMYLILLAMFFLTGCASMTTTEKDNKRSELDLMAKTAIDGLVEQDAELQKQIDDSLGYAIANMKVTKVPIVGAGGGEGVFVNKKTNKRIYFTVSRFDIGGGWGARSYKVLMLFETQESLSRLQNGTWEFQAGVEASAGTAAAEGSSGGKDEGYTLHVLSDGGASATATARVIRIKVNSELTND
jgi:PBP1b-binding outer membrane lipoprotein LpoB